MFGLREGFLNKKNKLKSTHDTTLAANASKVELPINESLPPAITATAQTTNLIKPPLVFDDHRWVC